MLVGTLVGGPLELPCSADYRALRSRFWAEGWFDPDPAFFLRKKLLALGLAAAGLA